MTRYAILVLCFFCFNAIAQPTHIINKPFATKLQYIDSLSRSFEGVKESDAIYKIDILQTWAEEHNAPELAGELTLLKFHRYPYKINPEFREKTLKELVASAHEAKLEYLEADALFQLGEYYWNSTQKQDVALENYIAAYKLYKNYTADEFPSKQRYVYLFGSAYLRYGDMDNAIKYLKEAAGTKKGTLDIYLTIYNSLGLCYRKTGKYDSAEFYLRKVYNEAIQRGDTIWLGIAGGNIGITYYLQKRYAEAIPLLEKDIEVGLSHHVIQNAAGSMCTLASIYFANNEPDKCEATVLKALSICESKPFWPNYNLAEQMFTLLYKVYAAKNDMRRAYLYADSAIMAKDSVAARLNSLNLTKAQEKSAFDQQKIEAEKLEISQIALAKKRNENIFFIAGIVIMLVVIIIIIRNYRLLSAEKHKSEELLLNILPAEVAEELKEKGAANAQQYDDVTVLFTDFVNFTEAGERMTPQQLVNELDTCFKAFDGILGKYNIEKIKTVGDAYLAVSGLPSANVNHATDVVSAAIEIKNYMHHRKEQLGDTTFGIRIGIHSGSVVAGIVGVKKFAYDIWGDTVNTAARMEQNSRDGKINISEATYTLVKDKYECEHRGKIEVKNKGVIDMYYIVQ
ncbi:MAG: hypothetical protein JWQ38_3417 [Flavipsychrobacter sp.]|nr:hypothetical protein [Flavipsychrobacter sp.]